MVKFVMREPAPQQTAHLYHLKVWFLNRKYTIILSSQGDDIIPTVRLPCA